MRAAAVIATLKREGFVVVGIGNWGIWLTRGEQRVAIGARDALTEDVASAILQVLLHELAGTTPSPTC